MKKVLIFVLSVVLAFGALSLSACSQIGPDNEEENGGSLDGVEFNSKNGEMYVSTKEGKTRIKISYSTGYKHGWIRQMARAFLMNDVGKEYYIVLDPDAEITTSVSSKLESESNLSEIYMPLASNWYSYAALGQLENLDDLYGMTVPGEEKTVAEKIRGSWTSYGITTYNNEQHNFVFPWNENITGIVYNKTLFEEYGWPVPTTYAQMQDLCEKIVGDTKGKIAPFVYPGTVGGYWDFVGTNWWLQLSGTAGLDKFMAFQSPEVYNPMKAPGDGKLAALEAFNELVVENRTKYTLKGSASKDNLKAQVSFVQRQAAMIPNGSWIEKESASGIKDELGMMRVPYLADADKNPDGTYKAYNYSGEPDYMMIPALAPNKAGAKKFLAFMCRDDMLIKYSSLTGAPRPFTYDTSKCEMSSFIESCFDIWSTSETWFEQSSSKLWTMGKAKKFQTTNPYTTLLANSDTVTPLSWAQSEYKAVKDTWDSWIAGI